MVAADPRAPAVQLCLRRPWQPVAIALGSVLCFIAPLSARADARQLTVDPRGTGSTCSDAAPCTIAVAQQRVREYIPRASGDVVINLRAGVYRLQSTWTFDTRDGAIGSNRIIWQAQGYGGPDPAKVTISGGALISGPWTLAKRLPDGRAVYRAIVAPTLESRQLYVNGRRAERAMSTGDP